MVADVVDKVIKPVLFWVLTIYLEWSFSFPTLNGLWHTILT